MKKYIYIFSLLFIALSSCEDVVDVDLKTSQERLVIEGMFYWEKGTLGNEQNVKLSRTSSYYNNQILAANDATVFVTNKETLEVFNFVEVENGNYHTANFVPIENNRYELTVVFNGETYTAEETLFISPEIEEIVQSTEEGLNTETPEVTVYFNDFIDQEDYYRVRYDHYRNGEEIDVIDFTYDSRFQENNLLFDFYESEEFEVGDDITISIVKISKQFYTFINILEQQGNGGIGPFSSPPANVKGNCINTTNEAHYPYGYFGLHQVTTATHIIE